MNKSALFQLRWRGEVTGPFPLQEILRRLDDREIGLYHEIGQGGQWTALGEYLEAEEHRQQEEAQRSKPVVRQQAAVPRPGGVARPVAGSVRGAAANIRPPPVPRLRSQKLFLCLGALLGFTGAHNFYAGYWGTGMVQLLLTVAAELLGFGCFVSWSWALVELFVVHADARGRPMA
jgi:hypothetical protein